MESSKGRGRLLTSVAWGGNGKIAAVAVNLEEEAEVDLQLLTSSSAPNAAFQRLIILEL